MINFLRTFARDAIKFVDLTPCILFRDIFHIKYDKSNSSVSEVQIRKM